MYLLCFYLWMHFLVISDSVAIILGKNVLPVDFYPMKSHKETSKIRLQFMNLIISYFVYGCVDGFIDLLITWCHYNSAAVTLPFRFGHNCSFRMTFLFYLFTSYLFLLPSIFICLYFCLSNLLQQQNFPTGDHK